MRTRNKILVAVATVTLVGSSIGAYAFFTAGGEGEGTAAVGTATPWNITSGAATGDPLFPGSGTQTLSYTVTNDGDGPQELITVAVAVAEDASGDVLDESDTVITDCEAVWFTVDNSGAPTTPQTIAPAGSVNGSATVELVESGTNQDACQGVTPKLIITAS